MKRFLLTFGYGVALALAYNLGQESRTPDLEAARAANTKCSETMRKQDEAIQLGIKAMQTQEKALAEVTGNMELQRLLIKRQQVLIGMQRALISRYEGKR